MLYHHQLKIITEDKPVSGLFLGTGSGKTLIALCLSRGSTLVICPKTQKEDQNWEREFKKNNMNLAIYIGDLPRLTVISKEEFRRDFDKLPKYNTIIVDEAHTCLGVTPNVRYVKKQPIPKTSQLFEALEKYIERIKPSRIYLVTATIIKSPMTVWGAARILGRDWNFYEFRDVFYTKLPIPGYREIWGPKKDSMTKDRLATAVRSLGYVGRLEEFFDVPEQTYKTIFIELTSEQKEKIKDIKIDYPDPIVRCGKIHQIENGVLSGNEFMDGETFDNGKMDKIMELALEFPKMIIFAKYRAQIASIESTLTKEGYNVLTLTGDTKDRGNVILKAQKFKECIFIAQSQVSAGWELPEYPCMVFASMTYSFVDYSQSLGRIQRANNIKKNLYISLVTKGGVDEAVYKCIINKKDFDERIYMNI